MTLVTPSSVRRLCAHCGVVELTGRADQTTCSQPCRQARARFLKQIRRAGHAATRLRFAYGDPPYPGKAESHYGDHRDFAGEVDHRALLARLQDADGWALSTDEPGFRYLVPLLVGIDYRIAPWVRGARPGNNRTEPLASWEAVLYKPLRHDLARPRVLDSLVHTARPRTTEPLRVVGAKPPAFWSWLFELVDARAGDHFDDLFPGSGGGAKAWEAYSRAAA